MLSHGNLLANARHNLVATGHRHDDRFLHIPPMFHVAGTSNLFAATWVGATQVILPRFDARAVARRSSASASRTPCWCRRCSTCCCAPSTSALSI